MQDKRRKLAQELRLIIAKVLHERASIATMLPVLAEFILLVKKRTVVSSSGSVLPHHKSKDRSELSTSTLMMTTAAATAANSEESATMSLLFSTLGVLHVLVDGSERCRRAILWDDKDELEERERRKSESLTTAAAVQSVTAAAPAPVAVKIELNGEEPTDAQGVMAPHDQLRNPRILIDRRPTDDKQKTEDKSKGKEKATDVDDEVREAREALQRTRSLTSLFLLGKDSELDNNSDDDLSGEQDFFAMLAQRDVQHAGESAAGSEEPRFQLLPPYLDAIRGRQTTIASAGGAANTTTSTSTSATVSAKEMLQQAKIKSHDHVHVPKLLSLLVNRVLKRREISLGKHGEIICKVLQILNTLAWHCPSHLLHKYIPPSLPHRSRSR
jgi:hypothetical protein